MALLDEDIGPSQLHQGADEGHRVPDLHTQLGHFLGAGGPDVNVEIVGVGTRSRSSGRRRWPLLTPITPRTDPLIRTMRLGSRARGTPATIENRR